MSNTINLSKAQTKKILDHHSTEIAKLTKIILSHEQAILTSQKEIQSISEYKEYVRMQFGMYNRTLPGMVEEILGRINFTELISNEIDVQENVSNNNQTSNEQINKVENKTIEVAGQQKAKRIKTFLVNLFEANDFDELKNDLKTYIKRMIKFGIYAALIFVCFYFVIVAIQDNMLIDTKKLNRYEIQLKVIEELHPDVYENSNEIMGNEETLEEIIKRINWKERDKELEEQIKALEKEKPEGIE